jgi:hypothetical protein
MTTFDLFRRDFMLLREWLNMQRAPQTVWRMWL